MKTNHLLLFVQALKLALKVSCLNRRRAAIVSNSNDHDREKMSERHELGPDAASHFARMAQVPILIGLTIGMALFLITFFVDIYEAIVSLEFLDRKTTILLILNMLDMVFIANLVIMVATNTYNTFRLKRQHSGEHVMIEGQTAYRRMKHRIVSTIIIISKKGFECFGARNENVGGNCSANSGRRSHRKKVVDE